MKKRKLPQYVFEKDGRWYVRRNFPTSMRDERGRLVYTQVVRRCDPHTPERATVVADEIERQFNEEAGPPAPQLTVGRFLMNFIEAKHLSVSSRTYQDYLDLHRRYIAGRSFAHTLLSEVSPLTIQNFYRELAAKVSGQMIRKVHVLLSMAFRQGVSWETLARNPCKGVVLPRRAASEIQIMPDVRKFVEVCRTDPAFYVLAFALETGMRPEEYLALQWSAVDLKRQTVTVRRAVTFLKTAVFKEPKTRASRRTMHITSEMCELLAVLRTRRDERLKELRRVIALPLATREKYQGVNYLKRKQRRAHTKAILEAFKKHDLVFPASHGGPMTLNNLGRREMKEACKKAGLPPLSLYSLRHSCATISLLHGVDVKTLSEKLGHSSPRITLEVYAHVLPSMREDASEKLAAVLY